MIVLDLRGLTFIDLAGVRVIVDASIEAWLGDRRLLLVRGPSHVDRVFADAEVSDVVEIGDLHSPAARPAAPSVRGQGPPGMDGAVPPIERVQRADR